MKLLPDCAKVKQAIEKVKKLKRKFFINKNQQITTITKKSSIAMNKFGDITKSIR